MSTAVSSLSPPAAPRDDPSREALAQRFSARLAHEARYVASWNRWLVFDGTAWRPDTTSRMRWEARVTCRDPMVPPAPPWFSTMTVCPRLACNR